VRWSIQSPSSSYKLFILGSHPQEDGCPRRQQEASFKDKISQNIKQSLHGLWAKPFLRLGFQDQTPKTHHGPSQILLITRSLPRRDLMPTRLARVLHILEAFSNVWDAARQEYGAADGRDTSAADTLVSFRSTWTRHKDKTRD